MRKKYEIDESLTGAERTAARKRAAYLANRDAAIARAREYRVDNAAQLQAKAAAKYRENREEIRAKQAEYRANPARREKARLTTAAWFKNNPERARETRREHYLRNAERIKAAAAEYAEKNKERMARYRQIRYALRYEDYVAAAAKRRAVQIQANASWDHEITDFITKEAAKLVRLRGEATGIRWHVDHVVPLRGKNVCGLHVWNNLAVIPAKDNLSKGNRI